MAKRSAEQTPKTPLDAAYAAYEAGNVVLARQLAKQVLASPDSAVDAASVKRVGKELMVVGSGEPTAHTVASELVARSKPYPKAYAFAGIAAAVWLLLVLFASTRG